MRFLAFLSVIFSLNALAAPECLKPKNFEAHWRDQVQPFFESGERRSFKGSKNLPIVYRAFKNRTSSRTVLIFPGYAENAHKHKETIYTFGCLGYSVYVMDWRGMGESGRALKLPSRQIVHIEEFSDYVADAEQFIALVKKEDNSPLYAFAHSTGGLIMAHVFARNPELFRAGVFNAPLFELDLGKWPYSVAYSLARTEVAVGRGMNYAVGFKDWDEKTLKFATNTGTRDEDRYQKYVDVQKAIPTIRIGGPSNQWILTVLRETTNKKLTALAKANKTPLMIYQAGDDHVVRPGGQNFFCPKAADCRILFFPNAKHEMYREVDDIRVKIFEEADGFFRKR